MDRADPDLGSGDLIPLAITLRERGPTPRKMRSAFTQAKKKAFFDGAVFFHSTFSDNRFSHSHATRAKYAPRKKRYTAGKVRRFGHSRPMEYTGRARRLSRTARVTSTSKGSKLAYPGLRVFNFRHPNSEVNLLEEFTTILPEEANRVADHIDHTIDRELNGASPASSTTVIS